MSTTCCESFKSFGEVGKKFFNGVTFTPCDRLASKKLSVQITVNTSGLSGFTPQKYTHFFGKWVALTHSTYCHTLYTLAKMGIFTS